MSVLNDKILNLPAVAGVYLFKDGRGRVLYVGKAKRLSDRVRSYLTGDDGRPQLPELMAEARDLDVVITESEVEALLLESSLVRQHRPRFNVVLQDDKSFPYVRVSVQEEFPRLSITRQVRDDGARYLGPFADVKRLRRTLRELRRIFPVRTCQNFEDYRRQNRPCLYFHIRRCAGPCTTRSQVTPPEYRALVDGLVLFLTGRNDELLKRLTTEMGEASETRAYERAARLRDQIRLLESARRPQDMITRGPSADVLGVARHGGRAGVVLLRVRSGRVVGKESRLLERIGGRGEAELLRSFVIQHYPAQKEVPRRIVCAELPPDVLVMNEALSRHAGHPVELLAPSKGRERRLVKTAERNAALALEDVEARAAGRRARFAPAITELQRLLDLPVPPHRMVCFDISNLGSDRAVAAVVASEDGRARRGLYRRMRIHRPGPDDFAMIAEAVERYWLRVESGEIPRPDLVVVDGGIGQLHAARAALDRAASRPVPLVALAKREETVVRENAPPLQLPRRSESLRALQRLRDEAHRFGLAYHRTLRRRDRLTSALEQVPGVGPARRAALLKAFGSLSALRESDPERVAREGRVSRALAERVVAALRAQDAPAAAAAAADPSPMLGDPGAPETGRRAS